MSVIIVRGIATRLMDAGSVMVVTLVNIIMKKKDMNVLAVQIHVLHVAVLIIVAVANLIIGEHTVRIAVKVVLSIPVVKCMDAIRDALMVTLILELTILDIINIIVQNVLKTVKLVPAAWFVQNAKPALMVPFVNTTAMRAMGGFVARSTVNV